jgi:hypothetical protein
MVPLDQVEKDKRDAERYRWLRSGHHFVKSGLFIAQQNATVITRVTLGYADTLIDGATIEGTKNG